MRFPARTATLRSQEYETRDLCNRRCGEATHVPFAALRLTNGDGQSSNIGPK
jgi:hypothetical protein